MRTISLYDALKQMGDLTRIGSPFSFEYITYNTSTNSSKGLRRVNNALLRTGYSRDKSDKSEVLVGYTIEPTGSPRWFYLPLLLTFNGMKVQP